MAPDGKVGFHQPYHKDKHGNMRVNPQMISLIKEYYFKLGLSKPAVDFLVSANPKDVYWLNDKLAAGFGIEVTTWSTKPEEKTVTLPKEFIDELTKKADN